jgi:hypothetical protein
VWFGNYKGCDRHWLRWYDTSGNWIPTTEERERQALERADRLAQRLRELGINPDDL